MDAIYILERRVIIRKSRERLAQLLNFETWEDVLHHFNDTTMLENAILGLDKASVNDDEWYEITSNAAAVKYIIEVKENAPNEEQGKNEKVWCLFWLAINGDPFEFC